MFPGAITVTVLSTTTDHDDYGDATSTATEVAWSGCMVAPRYATESTDPRVPPVIVGKTVYGPATVTIDSDDRIIIDGVTYEVDGLPGEWPWPAGGMAGIEVPLKRASAV